VSSTTSDAQGKCASPNVPDGWYSLEVNWTTNEDPMKSNPFWKRFLSIKKKIFSLLSWATKDSRFRVLAVGQPFQVASGQTAQKDLLKL